MECDFENSCPIWSILMHHTVLKHKIGPVAEGDAKNLSIRSLWANLTPVILPFYDFETGADIQISLEVQEK